MDIVKYRIKKFAYQPVGYQKKE